MFEAPAEAKPKKHEKRKRDDVPEPLPDIEAFRKKHTSNKKVKLDGASTSASSFVLGGTPADSATGKGAKSEKRKEKKEKKSKRSKEILF